MSEKERTNKQTHTHTHGEQASPHNLLYPSIFFRPNISTKKKGNGDNKTAESKLKGQPRHKMCDQNLKQFLCAFCGERIGDVVPTTQIRCGAAKNSTIGACGRVKDAKLATFFVKGVVCPRQEEQQEKQQEKGRQ